MHFAPARLSQSHQELRLEVREFLRSELPSDRLPGLGMIGERDRDFSRKLGLRGWLGMALPKQYGGHDRSAVERFIVVEELLAVGAPVQAHWIADRQSGPMISTFGTDAQRSRFLPLIAAGDLGFSIGMSEPDAGSDLAAVRTTATPSEGGWLLNGTKIWTSGARSNEWCIVLCRTSRDAGDRHHGLSQMLVDLHSPGIDVKPITFLDGTSEFNEVVFRDVFVPDDLVLGSVGMGWQQVTSELSFERAGPDRYMSSVVLLEHFLREDGARPPEPNVVEAIGGMVSRLWGTRQLSLSVSVAIDRGESPAIEAALVKDLGTTLEQEMVRTVGRLHDRELDAAASSVFERLLARATVIAPSYTIRGGTTEILRGVVANGLRGSAIRGAPDRAGEPNLLLDTLGRILQERSARGTVRDAAGGGWVEGLWQALAEAGLPWIGVGEEAGGSGGTTSEALSMAPLLGYHAAPLPVVETGLLAGWLLSQADMKVPAVPITVASDSRHDQLSVRRRAGGWVVSGVLHRVPWAQRCERVAALAQVEGELHVLALPLAGAAFKAGANLAGEPRDTVSFVDLRVSSDEVGIAPEGVHEEALRRRGALARALQMAGAASAAVDLSIEHADGRVQFGRPIAQFQAVKHLLVRAAEESALAVITSAAAVEMFESEHQFFVTAAAKVVCGRAARTVASAAHQVHGAIGMTQEYELQLRTRRLMSWSQEFGSESYWARRLGAYLAERGPDQLWGQIATGPLESTS